ncbi:hypothetical protein GCM10011573_39040 [Enterococcus wangshanyuanii]|uniref:Uncharacterized protein n=1 Tax=Enterococcus wangshanyuanii TaxID=2005703 RepID=A0ABQ1PXG0_9ENTE|nr:hypothetical protein GCM10011573_39040 [Enterococcus wangshanyuanii]
MQQKSIELSKFLELCKEVKQELASLEPDKQYHNNRTSDELYYKFRITCMFYF